MWLILSGLLLLIVWSLRLVFQAAFPLWIPIAATVAAGVAMLVGVAVGLLRARMAAGALERAITAQGMRQAESARPERRAEIQELLRQVQSGINALKASRLGAGKRGGAAALYSLPWYVIIGPPGAGKTTALKHSGLVFPYQTDSGGVRGVGGTRNCSFWFTNEAILLDTAGRYTTETDDRDEWLAFLQMLKKYRSRRPLNGVLVAISVAELIDAAEPQIEATGRKIRARIDEVMTELQMVVPVYVLFTKCDLIAGFGEFFGDLRKSDRAVAWGATLRLDLDKREPGKIFDAEFDLLTRHVHARALRRFAVERSREAREKIYQFPLELSGIKRNLSELIARIFQVNAFQGTPIFRGFYFTSGTQEGRPLDRVLARMGHAMGIRTREAAIAPVVEPKSYFLHDVFTGVVFPDGDIAAQSASERQRRLLMRVAVSAAAASLAVIISVPALVSFSNNRALIKDTEARVRAASEINWADSAPASDKVLRLKPVLQRLEELDLYREVGAPLAMSWGMYRGDELYKPTADAYVRLLQQGFLLPCQLRLEDKLRRVTGDSYLRERLDLKTYLMMSDVDHLDVDWETGRLISLWAEILRPMSNVSEGELKERLAPHVRCYLRLLKGKRAAGIKQNEEIVARARQALMNVPVRKRYYDIFVTSLAEEKHREDGDDTRANHRYPSINLHEMFLDRPDVLKVITSASQQRGKGWREVEGPYTERGHYAFLRKMADGGGLLERDHWIVPLTGEERNERLPQNLRRLADDYERQYIEQWSAWLTDLTVPPPTTVKEAIAIYKTLAEQEWPYLRILRQVEDHTQWRKTPDMLEAMGAVASKVGPLDIKKLGERVSTIPDVFKRTVEFGILQPGSQGSAVDTPLAKYIDALEGLRRRMEKEEEGAAGVDPERLNEPIEGVRKVASALLQPLDEKAKTWLTPLLLGPLQIVSPAPPSGSPGAKRDGAVPPRRRTP